MLGAIIKPKTGRGLRWSVGRGKRKKWAERTRPRYSAESPLQLDGRLLRARPHRPWWWAGPRLLLPVARRVPTYRDTRSGRRGARQTRIALAVCGAIIALVGETLATILVGILLVLVGLVVPVSTLRQRAWVARLRALGSDMERLELIPVDVVFDGRRVAVLDGGRVWRRVLTRQGDVAVQLRRDDGRVYLGVLPSSRRKSESLWFSAELSDPTMAHDRAPSAPSLPDFAELAELEPERVDSPVALQHAAWLELHQVLASELPDAVAGRGDRG
jgi:hypothetical protein